MKQEKVLRIANAPNRINSIKELQSFFVEHLAKNNVPEGIPAEIIIKDQSITVKCLGEEITAEPKIVMKNDNNFSVEYIFYVQENEQRVELWRFYLTSYGRIALTLEEGADICEFNNKYVTKHICNHVIDLALDSVLFRPTATQNGQQ